MSISTEKSTFDSLKEILEITANYIDKGKQEGSLRSEKNLYMKWKLDDFEYTKKGIKSSSAKGELITGEDWQNAISHIEGNIRSLEQYRNLNEKIHKTFSAYTPLELVNFINKFITDYFYKRIDKKGINEIAESFIKVKKGESVECGAIIQLVGIAIQNPVMDLQNGVILRQTKKEDLEVMIPYYLVKEHHYDSNYPSTIMHITAMARQPMEIQNKVEDSIVILRLFKVGSIAYKQYKMYSKALAPLFGGVFSKTENLRPADTCFLKEEEIEHLKRFWQVVEKVSIFTRLGTHNSFRDIAYKRYEEALIRNEQMLERRITDCMMGLESIYLRDGGEQQELSYRLRVRVAKLMSYFGYDAIKSKKMVQDAYQVRSRFVHGGVLSYDDVKELEEKYGSIRDLLLNLLDFLRLSIVIILFVNIEKQKLIDLLDNSMISKTHENELEAIISPTQTLVIGK